MKYATKLSLLFLAVFCLSCSELQDMANNLPAYGTSLSQQEIGNGLKAALKKGVSEEVSQLAQKNGFYNNPLAKIMLPKELQQVASGLRKIGLGSLVDEGIKKINHAAEDAVGRATPIFVNAITDMSFTDAKNILMGDNQAATTYLENKTDKKLYQEFHPEIEQSFAKVGADKIWNKIIQKYNKIPFVDKVNPDLTDYVTQQALNSVYTMIGKEELKIRQDVGARTTSLLKRVFALQDHKQGTSH